MAVVTHDAAGKLGSLEGHVAHWQVTNIMDVQQLIWAARGLQARHGEAHRFFGAYEQLQVPLAVAREALGIHGMSVDAATNFRDKARMKTLLRGAGIPCARHRLAASVDDAVAFAELSGFPIVVKPPAGAGAVSTYRVDHMEALRQAIVMSPPSLEQPVLLEEFIVGEEHSFEALTLNGEQIWYSLTHYYPTPLTVVENPWIQWAIVLPRELDGPQYADIAKVSRRALATLGMQTGLSHMEWFRRRDGSLAVSEIAARPPGAQITTLMSRAHDFDVVVEWMRAMIFNEFTVPERKYAAGAAFLRGAKQGRIAGVRGMDEVRDQVGGLITDAKIPQVGAMTNTSYEGEGFIIVRHEETARVEQALQLIVSTVRVDVA
jgi:biotin carboxylase